MPGKSRLKPCPQGSSCPYQNEGQHVAEFSHDERSDALLAKETKKKANQWKKNGGQRLGTGRTLAGRTLGGGVLGGRQLGRGNAPGRLARGNSREAAAAAAARRAEEQPGGATAASAVSRTASQPRSGATMTGDTLMENVGCHCSNCSSLDFLPLQCQSCRKSFCQNCVDCEAHACPEHQTTSKAVPICPLCGQAVPIRPGEPPDVRVECHIAEGCTRPKNTTRAIFTHLCSVSNCARKEAVPCRCKGCALNFCLHHRQPDSHGCVGSLKRTAAIPADKPNGKRHTSRVQTAPSTSEKERRGASSVAVPGRHARSQPLVADAFSAAPEQLQHQKTRRSVPSVPSARGTAALAWSCSVCTLRNSSGAQQCAVCGEGRPVGVAGASAKVCIGETPAVIDLCDDGPE